MNRFVHRCTDCKATFTYLSIAGWPDFSKFQCNECFNERWELNTFFRKEANGTN